MLYRGNPLDIPETGCNLNKCSCPDRTLHRNSNVLNMYMFVCLIWIVGRDLGFCTVSEANMW